ncbi:hypothetical protein GOBAR_AA23383 [Gossypium barbadense]|uniref:Piwi domain-containing protein n=1 Tax=Gossypium barbadense TaxID=3634 RepID=A0A2P5X1S6_GOSBA|nr:hypothetical protein GOBAR_AA23383 [Gossypium barbadense]
MLTLGQTPSILVISKVPTIIIGMGALFGFPEQSDVPSIAAMILSLKPVSDKVDDGIMKEALLDFYTSLGKRKPDQIIIFRDGLHSWGHFMKIKDASETSSSHGGMYALGVISVPQLSRLKDKVNNFILVR